MPAPTTASDFLTLVRRSGLVEPTALEPFARRLADDPPPDSPKALAALLVREGLLTNLHARHLLRGQWRKFDLCGKYKLLEHLGTEPTVVYLKKVDPTAAEET